MSTADPHLGTPLRRRIGITADPSEDELAQHWSLSPADLREVSLCRGADHQRRYALQLCMLRVHGRFLDDYRQAPLRIVNHLSRQLGHPPVLFLGPPEREPTEREQAQRIRRYLGLALFDQSAAARLRDWLRQGAAEGCSAADLLTLAKGKLRGWHITLPARARSNSNGSSIPPSRKPPLNSSRGSPHSCRKDCDNQLICCWKCHTAMPAPACSVSRTTHARRAPG
jgi:hypothetical protein